MNVLRALSTTDANCRKDVITLQSKKKQKHTHKHKNKNNMSAPTWTRLTMGVVTTCMCALARARELQFRSWELLLRSHRIMNKKNNVEENAIGNIRKELKR